MSGPQLLDAALSAAEHGWRVFPLVAGRKTPRRQLTDWEAKATSDHARIVRWWARYPGDNIGIACGPSGLVVVDLDVAKPGDTPPDRWVDIAADGAGVLAELARRAGHDLAATWTVQTPSGGRHRYYRAPPGRRLRNTAGRVGWKIDTRAAGGYVVAAGSIVDSHPYRVVDPTPPTELPGWLAELTDPPVPPALPRPVPRARGYAAAALRNEVQRVLDAQPGTRNDTLYRAARALGRLVAQDVLPRHVVADALQAAGQATGLDARPVAATIRSGIDSRLRHGAAS